MFPLTSRTLFGCLVSFCFLVYPHWVVVGGGIRIQPDMPETIGSLDGLVFSDVEAVIPKEFSVHRGEVGRHRSSDQEERAH